MRALGAQQAYMVALMRDTIDAYTDFLAEYWEDAMTKRVRALLAPRAAGQTGDERVKPTVPLPTGPICKFIRLASHR